MSENESNITRFSLDLDNLPPLTDEEEAQLAALEAMPDEAIDYCDAPFCPDAVWRRATERPIRTSDK